MTGSELPPVYELLVEKFETTARLTKQLYDDATQDTVTKDQVQKVAKMCHDVMKYYHKVTESEIRLVDGDRAYDSEELRDPFVLDEDIDTSELRGLMDMAKRKEGIFQQIIRNPKPDDVESISRTLSAFIKTESSVGNPVVKWLVSQTQSDTKHMELVYQP